MGRLGSGGGALEGGVGFKKGLRMWGGGGGRDSRLMETTELLGCELRSVRRNRKFVLSAIIVFMLILILISIQ